MKICIIHTEKSFNTSPLYRWT